MNLDRSNGVRMSRSILIGNVNAELEIYAIEAYHDRNTFLYQAIYDPALPSFSIFLTESMKSFLRLPDFASSIIESGDDPVNSQ